LFVISKVQMEVLNKLREECPRGNPNRKGRFKAVGIDKVGVHHDLESMLCACSCLKVFKILMQPLRRRCFDLNEKPGFPVLRHTKIHLPFVFGPQIIEAVITEAVIRP